MTDSLSVPSGSKAVEDAVEDAQQEPEIIDKILSKRLLGMSLQDRNAMDEEIHGVSAVSPEESPEFLKESLEDLSREIARIPDATKAAYLASQSLPHTYANTDDFRLRFLRCELFDAAKAALRMVNFLGFASHLFGHRVLQRPPRVTDFEGDARKLLQKGNIQILPFRDRSGRPIQAWVGDFGLEDGTIQSRNMAGLYLLWSVSDDPETQRSGITHLVWTGEKKLRLFSGLDNMEYHKRMMESIPVRMACFHFCVPDNPVNHMLRSMFGMVLGQDKQSRLRFHVGPEVELLYNLKSYGIPIDLIPVTGTGKLKTSYWKQWLKARQAFELWSSSSGKGSDPVIVCPRAHDVLFRSGTNLLSNPGNVALQSFFEARMADHAVGDQKEKTAITKSIIGEISKKGGRFLAYHPNGWWTELTDRVVVHGKVAVAFKNFQKARRKKRHDAATKTPASIPAGKAQLFTNQDHHARKRRKLLSPAEISSDEESQSGCCDGSVSSHGSCGDPCFLF